MSCFVRLILCLFFFMSCGTTKRTESEAVGLRSLADSVVRRELANRRLQHLYLTREVLLHAPDSAGRQSVARITETRRLLVETDSLSVVQQRLLRSDEAELATSKQEPPPARSFSFVLFLILLLCICAIARRMQ